MFPRVEMGGAKLIHQTRPLNEKKLRGNLEKSSDENKIQSAHSLSLSSAVIAFISWPNPKLGNLLLNDVAEWKSHSSEESLRTKFRSFTLFKWELVYLLISLTFATENFSISELWKSGKNVELSGTRRSINLNFGQNSSPSPTCNKKGPETSVSIVWTWRQVRNTWTDRMKFTEIFKLNQRTFKMNWIKYRMFTLNWRLI